MQIQQKYYSLKITNLYSYDARYVKIVAKDAGDSNLDIADISLIGSTGDNIEIGAVNIENNQISTGIGRLESDFVYDKQGNQNSSRFYTNSR